MSDRGNKCEDRTNKRSPQGHRVRVPLIRGESGLPGRSLGDPASRLRLGVVREIFYLPQREVRVWSE